MVPAFAVVIPIGGMAVGDRYAITATSREARDCVLGSWIVSPADSQVVAELTFIGPQSVIFKVLHGTIRFNCKVYIMAPSGWRGDYNRDTGMSVYQGPAVAPNGQCAFLIIHGQDMLPVQRGTYTHMWSPFRDEDGIL